MSKAITLWIPDFLNKQRIMESEQAWSKLKLPALRTLLKKADLFPTQSVLNKAPKDFYTTASTLFHQAQPLPIAATEAAALLKDFNKNDFWLKLDPVQMMPDRDTLILIPAQDLAIKEAEAEALIKVFNQHFEQDKVQIEYGSPTDWFLRIKQPVDLKSTPLNRVAYRSINAHYPTGHAAQYWRQLLNEASMLFFTHPINEHRRAQGKPEINGLWLWGEGQLDESALSVRPNARIGSKNSYLKGLATLTNAECAAFPSDLQCCLNNEQTHYLLMPNALHETLYNLTQSQWLEHVEWLENQWMAPLLQALKDKKVHSLLIELGDGYRYHIEPAHLKRFWRFKDRI